LIKVLLIVGVLGMLVVMLRRRSAARTRAWKRLLLVALVAVGVVSILYPNLTTEVANQVGVGRGADLLLYLLTAVFLYVVVGFYLRFRDVERQMTVLARRLAVDEARLRRSGPDRYPLTLARPTGPGRDGGALDTRTGSAPTRIVVPPRGNGRTLPSSCCTDLAPNAVLTSPSPVGSQKIARAPSTASNLQAKPDSVFTHPRGAVPINQSCSGSYACPARDRVTASAATRAVSAMVCRSQAYQ
jgi:hypothetical protein